MIHEELLEMFPLGCRIQTPNGGKTKIVSHRIEYSERFEGIIYLGHAVVYDNGKYAKIIDNEI